MRLTSLVSFVALVVVAVAANLSGQTSSANDQKIVDLERTVLTAFAKGDVKGFQQHLAPAAFGIDAATGVVGAADWVRMMKDFKVQKWDIQNAQVRWLNKDTAVLTYKYVGTGSFMGQPLPPFSWASSLWVNQNGAWKAAFHQESIAPPPLATKK